MIRDAHPDDLSQIREIYALEVEHRSASFETEVPSVAELDARMDRAGKAGLPYLVACDGQTVLGYCYAVPYRPRRAYRFTIESSIYLAKASQGKGLGSALMLALIARCQMGDWKQMLAVVGDPENQGASIGLHKKLGFEQVGRLKSAGYKFDRWLDTLILQKAL